MHQLSASNIMLWNNAGQYVAKVTGFAQAEDIITRDKWEKENVCTDDLNMVLKTML